MATIEQNGINFTLNGDAVTPFGGKYTNEQNFDATTGLYNDNQNKLNRHEIFSFEYWKFWKNGKFGKFWKFWKF